jgi:flagellar assembly protein FliH
MAFKTSAQALKYEFAPLLPGGGGAAAREDARTLGAAEIEALQAASFRAGEDSGRTAAEESLARREADALEAAAAALKALADGIAATRNGIEKSACALSHAVGKAIAGYALAHAPLEVIRPMVAEALDALYDQPHLVIEVHEAVVDRVRGEAEAIAAETGFAGRVRVRAGARAIADCRIDWGEGGLERRTDEIVREISDRAAAYGIALPPAVTRES